ncbi:hypothetical protein DFH27DRAFT_468363, partial [Peziza echinospora]
SLREDRVSEAAKAHPSPITAFCVSMDSNLLLSCSADPPIIHLHNRQLNTTVDIKPKASSKPVICCAFHPTRKNTFLLAFADGVLAAYDSTRLIRGEAARAAAKKGNVGSGGGEHIHSFGHLHDSSISGGSGITGVEFIPGYRARAVSVGEDGRLFIVDFEKRDVLGSWHVGAPATCLSVREAVGKDAGKGAKEAGWMAAVGTIHGRCFVFDGDGKKVCEQTVDAEAGRVLDVEWVLGEVAVPPGISGVDSISAESGAKSNATTRYPETLSSAKSKDTLAGNSDAESSESALARLPTNPPLLPEIPKDSHWQDVVETYTAGYMKLFSPVKKRRPAKTMSVPEKTTENPHQVSDPRERVNRQDDQRSAISAPQLWDERPLGPKAGPSAPATEPGSSGIGIIFDKTGGKSSSPPVESKGDSSTLSLRRVTSLTTESPTVIDHAKILSDIRSIRGESDKSSKPRGLALFAPYMPPRPGGQR